MPDVATASVSLLALALLAIQSSRVAQLVNSRRRSPLPEIQDGGPNIFPIARVRRSTLGAKIEGSFSYLPPLETVPATAFPVSAAGATNSSSRRPTFRFPFESSAWAAGELDIMYWFGWFGVRPVSQNLASISTRSASLSSKQTRSGRSPSSPIAWVCTQNLALSMELTSIPPSRTVSSSALRAASELDRICPSASTATSSMRSVSLLCANKVVSYDIRSGLSCVPVVKRFTGIHTRSPQCTTVEQRMQSRPRINTSETPAFF